MGSFLSLVHIVDHAELWWLDLEGGMGLCSRFSDTPSLPPPPHHMVSSSGPPPQGLSFPQHGSPSGGQTSCLASWRPRQQLPVIIKSRTMNWLAYFLPKIYCSKPPQGLSRFKGKEQKPTFWKEEVSKNMPWSWWTQVGNSFQSFYIPKILLEIFIPHSYR